jgi:hypothetical protein
MAPDKLNVIGTKIRSRIIAGPAFVLHIVGFSMKSNSIGRPNRQYLTWLLAFLHGSIPTSSADEKERRSRS